MVDISKHLRYVSYINSLHVKSFIHYLHSKVDGTFVYMSFNSLHVKAYNVLNDTSLIPMCQKLSNPAVELGYRTVITDFNAKTGVTSCTIISSQNGVLTGFFRKYLQ